MDGIRDASTLMLLTKGVIGINTLIVKRNSGLAFASENFVFPGGAHHEADKELAKSENDFPKIAAIRECFEETGILLGRINGEKIYDKFRLEMTLRREINKSPHIFGEFLNANKIELETRLLRKVAVWIPPFGIKRRYRTWFFVACIDEKPRHLIDGFEITEAIWMDPKLALEDSLRGTKSMMFPTRANLSFLAKFDEFEELNAFLDENTAPTIEPNKISSIEQETISIEYSKFYPYHEQRTGS